MVGDQHPAPVGPEVADHRVQQHRLAAAGAAHDGHDLGAPHLEVHAEQHAVAPKRLVHAFDARLWGRIRARRGLGHRGAAYRIAARHAVSARTIGGVIYLDNNATTRPSPGVIEAVRRALEQDWANPSSIHRPGQSARRVVELARESVAALIGARARDVVFTSGGTESIDLAFRGALRATGRRVVVTTAVEHEAVRSLCDALETTGVEVRQIPLARGGVADADALPGLLTDDVALVSVQWANNETGAVQPVERIGALCRERRIPFHCDGTQWAGKMPTDISATPIDLLTLSAHKLHGPKGVGALAIRRGTPLAPVLHGVQEQERRGGTENVPGIAGFGAAAEEARAWFAEASNRDRLGALRDRFEQRVLERVPDAHVNGPADPWRADHPTRLWNTTNIAFPRLEAEALLMLLSEKGVCASAGAACSSGSLEPSPVLLAMGVAPEYAHGAIRFSLSRESTWDELERAAAIIEQCVGRLRASMPQSSNEPA
ncbi:MAG: cysteine desulfurase [Phycisphaerales bacterium]|nr:MAG: cysteine desulfurase [Phycisphaerales bacterium]